MWHPLLVVIVCFAVGVGAAAINAGLQYVEQGERRVGYLWIIAAHISVVFVVFVVALIW